VSSTVRRCIEKETGREYAAKIIDLCSEENNAQAVRESTLTEVSILRTVAGHPNISTYLVNKRRKYFASAYIIISSSSRYDEFFCTFQSNCMTFLNLIRLFSWFLRFVVMVNCLTT